jgi:general secretion pathway protein N
MNAASQRRLTPVLVIAAAVLGGLLLIQLLGRGRGVYWNPPRQTAPLPAVHGVAALPPPQPLEQFAQVWQQPLFSPDRKPAAHATEGSSVGELELTGIIMAPTVRIALLRRKDNNTSLQLVEGHGLPDGSWTLAEVRPRSALFDSPHGRVELKLPAGAPFTDSKSDNQSPGSAEIRRAEAGVSPLPPDPQSAGRERPRQGDAALRDERLRRLKAIIQQRRAAQPSPAHEGAR